MESTIDAISERLSFANPDLLEKEAAQLTRQRLDMLRRLREARQELCEARSSEYSPMVIAGQSYAPAEGARMVQRLRETAQWLPGPITLGASLPLSKNELLELYHSNAVISAKDEREMALLLPETGKLLAPVDFENLITAQTQIQHNNFAMRRDLWTGMSGNRMSEVIQSVQTRLIQAIEPLQQITGWSLAALAAGREGGIRRQIWEDLLNEVERVYAYSLYAERLILSYNPSIAPNCLTGRIEKVIDEIIAYVEQDGKLGGLKLLTKRDWKTCIENTRVNGNQPETTEHFQALKALIGISAARNSLVMRWQRQMASLGVPPIPNLGAAPEKISQQFIGPLRRYLNWHTSTWLPLEQELKYQSSQWEAFIAEAPVEYNEYWDILRLRAAVVERLPHIVTAECQRRQYYQNEEKLLEIERNLAQVGNDTTNAEVVYRLRHAVKQREADAYRAAFEELINLQAKREVLQRRQALLAKLENVAPGWATAVRERIEVHGERHLPGNAEDAWLWRQLQDELERRAKVSLEELQEKITQLNAALFQTTAELVEKKAWAQKARNTTVKQQQALQGWREMMRKVGKGTGKRAPRLLAAARELMPTCQSAVPVWIMPLSYVAKNFDMQRNRFDVVIIDEASQADITALAAIYLGDQVVIVGDHQQVSPLAVGQRLDEVDHLIDEHLQDIPLSNMYDGKLSIYDLAKTTFKMICLLEHFRCVSPIIQFSNELSYDGKIKPLRDDSEVTRRPATVAYRVKGRSRSGKVNTDEALAVASLLIAASGQPEYKDATFGVISMVGNEQALEIERLLRLYMPPTEYVKRRVLCGDAAQFQGDERDVMFLSLVDVPAEGGPLPLRTGEGHEDLFKKHFNVAASRARDQMWVVYSLDPELDLKPEDIRRRLILHARDQSARNQEMNKQEQKVESEFEKQVFSRLTRAGYRVVTQWPVGAYRIDMVAEGNGKRLAVECDGDRWHPQEKLEEDMARQAILERLGWRFVRIRGSQFFRDPEKSMEPIFAKLRSLDIPPEGMGVQANQDHVSNELKERIVRRADELRQQWLNLGDRSQLQIAPASVLSQNGVSGKLVVEQASVSPLSPVAPVPLTANRSSSQTAFPTRIEFRSNASVEPSKPAAPAITSAQPLRSAVPSIQRQESSNAFDLLTYLLAQKLRIIDKRATGGAIWVIGGKELKPIMQQLESLGIQFGFTPNGGKTTGFQPSWYYHPQGSITV